MAAGKEVVHSRAHCQLPWWKEKSGWREEPRPCEACRDDGGVKGQSGVICFIVGKVRQ